MDISAFNTLGKELKDTLNLRTYPIAVKFLKSESEIPEGAIMPKRDLGKGAAFCQATSMARMNGRTVAMGKMDHWCWNPIVAFGLCEANVGDPAGDTIVKVLGIEDEEKARAFWDAFPRLPLGEYPYVVVAPVERATFEPDVILVYSDTYQVLSIIGAIRFVTGQYVHSDFDSIDSCIHAIVEPMRDGQYRITFPDPGDHARGLAREDEVITTIPAERFEEFMNGVRGTSFMYGHKLEEIGFELESPVPPFYHELFEIWGIEEPGAAANARAWRA